jgi:hypothetical protein
MSLTLRAALQSGQPCGRSGRAAASHPAKTASLRSVWKV